MTSAVNEWAPTVGLIGLVVGFLIVLGRQAVPAIRRPRLASLRVRGLLLAARAGTQRLSQLQARTALPPWDDLDKHFPLHRPSVPPQPPRDERG